MLLLENAGVASLKYQTGPVQDWTGQLLLVAEAKRLALGLAHRH